MLEDFPKEKLQEIYEILPEDLKEALFSQEVADTINDISLEENLEKKQISKIIEYVGYVFLGLLSPNEFEKAIKEKLFLTEETAHRISQQIIRTIFLPLKTNLELIHKTKINPPPEITEEKPPAKEEPSKEEMPPARRQGRDTYREPIG